MKKTAILTALVLLLTGFATAGEIHNAAELGDLDRVKALLEGDSGLLNARATDGKTAMLSAAYMGNVEVVEYLLDAGADINARTNSNSVALHGAGYYGRDEVAKLLIARGADLNAANAYGFTPLLSACAGGRTAVARMLIEAGADITARNQEGAGPLLFAALGGIRDIFDLLLERGASLESKDNDGDGLLHYAATGGNLDMVQHLIDLGMDIRAKSDVGTTPLHSAAGGCSRSVAELLLSKGADINAVGESNRTPILDAMWVLTHFDADSVIALLQVFVDHGADLNRQTSDNETPLMIAVMLNNPNVVRLLLENGADPNIANRDGQTPLMVAISKGDVESTQSLLSHSAGVDLKESHYGSTALHTAARKGNFDIVKTMLPLASDINVKDNDGNTPLYYACKYGHKQIAGLLKENGGTALNPPENFDSSPALGERLQPKEATLWYLDHCGWAVKTANHFLIFDYWQRSLPTDPSLANGCIVPEQIADQNVEVFSSHTHRDHYDSVIFDWYGTVPNLTYYFGFQAEYLPEEVSMGYNGQPYQYVGPRENVSSDDMEIHTIRANDAGVGFLIEVDGLKIYHAGDHAGWREGQRDGFISEIDYLAGLVDEVDFAFVNVTGCHTGDTIALAEGTYYTLEKLSPRVMIPTHATGREWIYQSFADKVATRGYKVDVICPLERGDKFCYAKDQIM